MEARDFVRKVQIASGPEEQVLIHVVDRDVEYWLEVTDVRPITDTETGWVNGVLVETRPIFEGVRARVDRFNPRSYFNPSNDGKSYFSTQIADISCKSPEQIRQMQRDGELPVLDDAIEGTVVPGPDRIRQEILNVSLETMGLPYEPPNRPIRFFQYSDPNRPFTSSQDADFSEPHYEEARKMNELGCLPEGMSEQEHDKFHQSLERLEEQGVIEKIFDTNKEEEQ